MPERDPDNRNLFKIETPKYNNLVEESAHRFKKTVPVSKASANIIKAAWDAKFPSALVHTEAVKPYGESFINVNASSSDETYSPVKS